MKQITNRELKILEYLDFLEDWRDSERYDENDESSYFVSKALTTVIDEIRNILQGEN